MTTRVGVIGLGLMGDVHVRAFQGHPDFEVVAVCDPDALRLNQVADSQRVARRYTSHEELVAREQLDLLAIAAPPRFHAPLTKAACARGWHVLCEKPMAMSVAEAEAMAAAAHTAGRIHILGHQSRFNPVRARIRELLAAGAIGAPRHLLYYQLAEGIAATARWTWWSSRAEGGGMLNEYASHQIDLARWWLGEITAADGRIATFQATRPAGDGTPSAVTSDDYAEVGLTFESGALARIIVSAASGSRSGPRLEIHGVAGSLVLDADDRLWLTRPGGTVEELTVPETRPSLIGWGRNDTFTPAFQRLVEELAVAIRDGRQPRHVATLDDGVVIQRVLEAARSGERYER
jgi:predicted dehydrogenase